MTILRENFRPVGDVLPIARRDFPLADKNLATPDNPLCLEGGEWMTLNASYKLVRAASVAAAGNVPAAGALVFPLWYERGRHDVQAQADCKPTVLWMNGWEFETRVFDAAATVGSGAAISALWQPVKVASITIGTRVYCGLVGHGGAGTDSALISAYVTKLPAHNGGWLRIRGGSAY
jgi:hypothetical protein